MRKKKNPTFNYNNKDRILCKQLLAFLVLFSTFEINAYSSYFPQLLCKVEKQSWKQRGVAGELNEVKYHSAQIIQAQICKIMPVDSKVKRRIDNRRENAEQQGKHQGYSRKKPSVFYTPSAEEHKYYCHKRPI